MNWAEVLEEKNVRIAELEAQLADRVEEQPEASHTMEIVDVALTLCKSDLAAAKKLIKWVFETLKPPVKLIDGKLPAVREVRERLGKYLEKKT